MDLYSSFLHTAAWERFQRATGLHCERIQETLYIERAIPKGTYWQSSRCPIAPDWKIPEATKESWFLRLEPDTEDSLLALQKYAVTQHLSLKTTIAYQPRQTSIVDITGSEEDVLMRMKSKHRYNIRLAEKHGVKIELYHTDIATQIPRFLTLLKQTADRHDFHAHADTYYVTMVQELEQDGMIHLAIASYNGEDVAAHLLITNGTVATYLHGASTYAHREVMAPYLMHWEVIQYARSHGCTAYDLWGTHAVQNNDGEWEPREGHASAGTTRFKLGFGGTVISYPGTYDLVIRPIPYKLYSAIKALRSRKRAFT